MAPCVRGTFATHEGAPGASPPPRSAPRGRVPRRALPARGRVRAGRRAAAGSARRRARRARARGHGRGDRAAPAAAADLVARGLVGVAGRQRAPAARTTTTWSAPSSCVCPELLARAPRRRPARADRRRRADARSWPSRSRRRQLRRLVGQRLRARSRSPSGADRCSAASCATAPRLNRDAAREGRRARAPSAPSARRAAASDERTRIAGELHDVVAHALSAMVVQAGGAAAPRRARPAQAREAFGAVEATGREALTEIRPLLGVLRREDEEIALAPQP